MGWAVYLIMYGIRGDFSEPNDLKALPVLLSGPPNALFLFGAVAKWALQGFTSDRE